MDTPEVIYPRRTHFCLQAVVTVVAAVIIGVWLWATPPGLLGKADAVGYALCHRIAERSLFIGERQFPMCARCTGTYLGVLAAMVMMVFMRRTRVGGLPPFHVIAVLVIFVGVMIIDGVNSYLTLFEIPHLYEPRNWLRLVTGALNGVALSTMVYPIFNQTVWQKWSEQPIISGFRELGVVLVVSAAAVALALSDWQPALYLLALASAGGVILMLTMLDTMILMLITRRDNGAAGWRDALLPLTAGAALAIFQIGFMDAVRFAVFGSWAGLVVPK